MSDFFARLLDRAQQRAPVLEWRRPGLFESIGSMPPEQAPGTPAEPGPPVMAQQALAAQSRPSPVPDFAAHEKAAPASAAALAILRPDSAALAAPAASVARPTHADAPASLAPRQQSARMTEAATPSAQREVIHHLETVRESRIELQPQLTIAHHHPAAVASQANQANPASPLAPRQAADAAPLAAASATRAPALQLVESVVERRAGPVSAPQSVPGVLQQRAVMTPAPVGPAPRQLMRTNPLAASAAQPVAPSISVSIGRIEIRAEAKPVASSAKAANRGPQLSLDAYLRSRGGHS